MLPLDLHVLSLSLAFILSQDQTLHCQYFYCTLFCLSCSEMILASDLLVYLYLSKGRNWRLGLYFPKRLLLHFCLSISIISKISQSQTSRVTARPFVSFASAKVGKNHPNFQIHTQIHTTTRRFPHQFARVHYIYSYHEAGRYFFLPIHLTLHLSRGRSTHGEAFIHRSPRMRLLPRVLSSI